ncbi:carbohydrate ABC transporter permease [Enterococcus sp.]|uniref:carbohydrate ABC transporter permease n=1 Tax=Enterococcus sp. TaxID=35783 RepID=UPI003C756EB3
MTVRSYPQKKKIKRETWKDYGLVGLFLAIPICLLLLFSYFPIVKLFEISFTDWNGLSAVANNVGLANYREVFGSGEVFKPFVNNLAYIITALVQQVFGLVFAILLDSNLKKRSFFRTSIFLPYIINGVAIAFIFNYMFDFNNNPINEFLRYIGLGDSAVRFLGTSYFSNFSLAFISFWKYVGFTMVIYLSALQTIPHDVYEAARVDGANFWQTIRYITIPGVKKMVGISIILSMNGALQAYFEPFLITKGGPNDRTQTFVTKTLEVAFNFQKFGKAAVMSITLLVIILIVVGITQFLSRKKES